MPKNPHFYWLKPYRAARLSIKRVLNIVFLHFLAEKNFGIWFFYIISEKIYLELT